MNGILYKNFWVIFTGKDWIDLSKTYFWLSSCLSSDRLSSNPDSSIPYLYSSISSSKKKKYNNSPVLPIRGLDQLIQLKY